MGNNGENFRLWTPNKSLQEPVAHPWFIPGWRVEIVAFKPHQTSTTSVAQTNSISTINRENILSPPEAASTITTQQKTQPESPKLIQITKPKHHIQSHKQPPTNKQIPESHHTTTTREPTDNPKAHKPPKGGREIIGEKKEVAESERGGEVVAEHRIEGETRGDVGSPQSGSKGYGGKAGGCLKWQQNRTPRRDGEGQGGRGGGGCRKKGCWVDDGGRGRRRCEKVWVGGQKKMLVRGYARKVRGRTREQMRDLDLNRTLPEYQRNIEVPRRRRKTEKLRLGEGDSRMARPALGQEVSLMRGLLAVVGVSVGRSLVVAVEYEV